MPEVFYLRILATEDKQIITPITKITFEIISINLNVPKKRATIPTMVITIPTAIKV